MWNIEFTDTFGGEANYSWVRRAEMIAKENESQQSTMRRAKALVGLTGVRGRTHSHGDTFEFRPYHSCTVMFVQYRDHE